MPGANVKDYALAVGKVRYVGEAIVAVVAETRELARDASELVEIEYEPIDAITDARHAQDDGVPTIHEDAGGNLMWEGVYEWGDLDAAFAEADKIVKIDELHFHRFNSTPLECDGALVEYNRGIGQWTIHDEQPVPRLRRDHDGARDADGARQAPLRHAGHRRRLRQQDHVAPAARRVLPARAQAEPAVQWTEWRTDFHLSMSHGNERWFHETEVAVKNDGTLLGFRTKALDDAGAWLRYEPLGGVIWAQVTPGMYRWQQHPASTSRRSRRTRRRCRRTAATRACSTSGSPSAIIDIVAHELDLDPVEVRKRNYIRAEDMPYDDAERLRLRLGRLRADARHRARPDRLSERRGAARRGRSARQAARASASARRSTPARTTSASRA